MTSTVLTTLHILMVFVTVGSQEVAKQRCQHNLSRKLNEVYRPRSELPRGSGARWNIGTNGTEAAAEETNSIASMN